ncbi:hypothetical protein, partial [Microbispora corallina]|uniref:hypothetical protein n=1 Tax=Microbispora corallina TaxID=83302 RepID=UPI0031E2D70D
MAIRNGHHERQQRAQQRHEKELAMEQSGHQMQQEDLRDLLNNPQVMEMLLDVEDYEDPTLEEIAGEHMNRDQVLAIFDGEDLWRKGWKNKLWTTRVLASYPFPESDS